tara:strand:+ start:1961 stop:2125 length:165 start_codon:yes stop_codon:yes gene_type:complete
LLVPLQKVPNPLIENRKKEAPPLTKLKTATPTSEVECSNQLFQISMTKPVNSYL